MSLKNALFALGALALASMVSAQPLKLPANQPPPPPDARSTTMTLPNTPEEMWSRILLLLKKNGGFTSKLEAEEIFGLRFTHTEVDDEKQVLRLGDFVLHTVKQEVPALGLVSMGLFEDPKNSQFDIEWGPQRAELPGCLQLEKVTSDLIALGWKPGLRSMMPGRGRQKFYRAEDLVISKKTGIAPDVFTGSSILYVFMPHQDSQCVIGFAAAIWRH